jgi:hypothetical protein
LRPAIDFTPYLYGAFDEPLGPASALVQLPDGDGLRLAGLKAKIAENAFIKVFIHHRRLVTVLLKNTHRTDPHTPAALSDTDACGHVDTDADEQVGRNHFTMILFKGDIAVPGSVPKVE